MWVMVPVAERSMSPSMRDRPTAPPGWRSGRSRVSEPPLPAPITGLNPIAEKTPRAHSKVEASKPEKTRGSESGASDCPTSCGGKSPRMVAVAGDSAGTGRRSAATMAWASSGAFGPDAPMGAEKRADAARGVAALVASIISPIGVMPAMVSFENGNP